VTVLPVTPYYSQLEAVAQGVDVTSKTFQESLVKEA
jgi:hypothetical protein